MRFLCFGRKPSTGGKGDKEGKDTDSSWSSGSSQSGRDLDEKARVGTSSASTTSSSSSAPAPTPSRKSLRSCIRIFFLPRTRSSHSSRIPPIDDYILIGAAGVADHYPPAAFQQLYDADADDGPGARKYQWVGTPRVGGCGGDKTVLLTRLVRQTYRTVSWEEFRADLVHGQMSTEIGAKWMWVAVDRKDWEAAQAKVAEKNQKKRQKKPRK